MYVSQFTSMFMAKVVNRMPFGDQTCMENRSLNIPMSKIDYNCISQCPFEGLFPLPCLMEVYPACLYMYWGATSKVCCPASSLGKTCWLES
jgi:hypothetical protein